MSSPAYLFSADRALFAEMKGSQPLLDIPSHEGLGAVNPNEEVTGPHSPSTSGASRHVWESPTVARSFISAAAMPFFVCDSLGACSRRRTILTSRHLVVPFHLIVFFLSFCFAVSSFYFSHACSSRGYSSLPDFRRALLFRAFRNGFDSINRFHFQFFAFLFSCSFLCCSTGKF